MLEFEQIRDASLERLVDWTLEAYHSDENQAKIGSGKKHKFIIYMGRPVYSRLFGFSMERFFTDAATSLRAQLQTKLFVHHILREDSPLNLRVGVDLGTALEATLFGMPHKYPDDVDPTYVGRAPLKKLEQYKELALPDFRTSGWMPEAHRLYGELGELAGDALQVYMPGWARGPFSMATILRGFNDVFIDFLKRPQQLYDFMMFLADARIHFERQRLDFLGIAPDDFDYRWTYCSYRYNYNSDIFEDEVDGALFSPQMNRDIIIPSQKRVSDFYGGVGYYHSCGDLTPFLEDIATLGVCRYQHVSPNTFKGYQKLNELWHPDVVAQVSIASTEVYEVSEPAAAEARLRSILPVLGGRQAEICVDALFSGSWDLVEKVGMWRDAFRRLEDQGADGAQ